MRPEIEQYVKACPVCAVAKHRSGRPLGLLQSVADPHVPWEEIAMDFVVELPSSNGHNVIWTIIDLFSKQAHFVPCRGLPSARALAGLFIRHVYRLHGVPRRIISDRGVQFTARFWRQFLTRIGSSQGLSTAYHPSTNGAAERANAMVERYLRCYVSYQQDDWADLLPFAEVAYNNTVHRSTGLTPFRIVTGRDFTAIPELEDLTVEQGSPNEWSNRIGQVWPRVKSALNKAAMQYKHDADKRRAAPPLFQVGDRVYLSTKYIKSKTPSRKLGPQYLGPFTISRVINPVTVALKLPPYMGKIHPVFHCSLLKPVAANVTSQPCPGPIYADQYEVEGILDSQWRKGTLTYLVKWKGYPLSEASWVRVMDICAPRLLNKYHHAYPHKPGPMLR